jgi:hypothetical protein
MKFPKKPSAQWGITAKLTTLFVLFGFVPMAIIGLIAYNASRTIEGSAGTRFQNVAEGVADKIDRNLFERYGDVQAFGINRVLDQKASWYRTEEQSNPTTQVMNQYVDTYDLYYLTILVDLEGRVIAVNSKDADGKPIQSKDLYRKNYSETAWFRALKSQDAVCCGREPDHDRHLYRRPPCRSGRESCLSRRRWPHARIFSACFS